METSLSQCENIMLEAKRILFNEQIFKTSFRERFSYDSSENENIQGTIDPEDNILIIETCSTTNQPIIHFAKNTNLLLKKYFTKWKERVETEKRSKPNLESFISNIKLYKTACAAKISTKENTDGKNIKSGSNFQSRYKAQRYIIDNQKAKLDEQEKIISELKLGIIREDLLKSIEKRKFQIREIFANCSERLMVKAPLIQPTDEREKIMISSQKAPKQIQQMEKRAIERAKYREQILERKKVLEDARQKLLEEAIEKKRVLEEEERRRSIELINEQRRKELELRKIRQYKRQLYEEKVSKAEQFYENVLVDQCFRKLTTHCNNARYNWSLAVSFYLHKEKTKVFKHWIKYVESKYEGKYLLADAHYNYKLLGECIVIWKEFKLDCMRSRQVAEDFYDFKLTNMIFVHWHRYVCKEIMIEHKKIQLAKRHNHRRILFDYFYLWKSLPAVLQLEKAQEERKRKWREKVWEILPDYQPTEQF